MDTKHSNKESYDLPTLVSLEEGPRAAGTRGSDFKNKCKKLFCLIIWVENMENLWQWGEEK